MQDDRRHAIFETVATIIEDCMDISKSDIKLSSRLVDDLGLDSIGGVELVSALQAKYSIFVDRSQLKHITTVGEIVIFIEDKTRGNN